MAASLNKIQLIGYVGRDPEGRDFQGGRMINFTLATSEQWRDRQSGERRERTEWHRIVIFNENLGKIAEAYLRKGSKVYLEGTIQSRKYQDKDGNERQVTEVVLPKFRGDLVLLDGRGDASGDDDNVTPMRPRGGGGRAAATARDDDLNDDIPF